MPIDIEQLEAATAAESEEFWRHFTAELAYDDGEAARQTLAAGHPIYVCEADTPKGRVIKQHPDGRRELVYFDQAGEHVVQIISTVL